MAKKLFSPDHQPSPEARKHRRGWRQKILDELEAQGQSEEDFLRYCMKIAFTEGHAMQQKMLEMIIHRLAPIEKAVLPMYQFQFGTNDTPADKIDRLIEAVGEERMPADVASLLVNMIKTGIDVKEVTELAERLERLERLLQEQMRNDG